MSLPEGTPLVILVAATLVTLASALVVTLGIRERDRLALVVGAVTFLACGFVALLFLLGPG